MTYIMLDGLSDIFTRLRSYGIIEHPTPHCVSYILRTRHYGQRFPNAMIIRIPPRANIISIQIRGAIVPDVPIRFAQFDFDESD